MLFWECSVFLKLCNDISFEYKNQYFAAFWARKIVFLRVHILFLDLNVRVFHAILQKRVDGNILAAQFANLKKFFVSIHRRHVQKYFSVVVVTVAIVGSIFPSFFYYIGFSKSGVHKRDRWRHPSFALLSDRVYLSTFRVLVRGRFQVTEFRHLCARPHYTKFLSSRLHWKRR